MVDVSKAELEKMIEDNVNRAIGQTWLAAAENKRFHDENILKHNENTIRMNDLRGWIAGASTKLYETYEAAREAAAKYSLNKK